MKSTVNNNKKARGRGEGLKRERKRRRWRGEGRKGTGDAMTEGKESSRNGTPRREESWFCQLLLPGGGGEGGEERLQGRGSRSYILPSTGWCCHRSRLLPEDWRRRHKGRHSLEREAISCAGDKFLAHGSGTSAREQTNLRCRVDNRAKHRWCRPDRDNN